MTFLPDTRTAPLRHDGETWHLAGDQRPRPRLCGWCCIHEECAGRKAIDRINAKGGLQVHLRTCRLFVPPLAFSVLEGLEAPRWNTLRLGKAWGERLRPGQRVGILDTKNRRLLRRMVVEATFTAPLATLLPRHARHNHAMLARDPAEAPDALYKVLRNAYGSIVADPAKPFVAVYLRSETDP